MAQQKRSSGGRGGAPGCLFWLLLLCIVLLLFLVNIGKIKATLSNTNFNEILQTQKKADDRKAPPVSPAPVVQPEPASPSPSIPMPADKPDTSIVPAADATPPAGKGDTAGEPAATSPAVRPTAPKTEPKGSSGPGTAATTGSRQAGSTAGGSASAPGAAVAVPAKKRTALLYFVRIDDDGIIVRQEVTRQISASDQPLTDALAALLGGPSEEEIRRHLLSLIPAGTKLISVQVRGSTAFLNFNEAFMYNHYGIEGYAGQLKQIVYTATAFSSVQEVQILIEGERHDYLGGEGVYIGKPLSRNSF